MKSQPWRMYTTPNEVNAVKEAIYSTHVGRSDGITVPGDTKHAVAARLDDELMLSSFDGLTGDDVLDTPVTAPSTSDALERRTIGGKYHSLAVRVKFNYAAASDAAR